MSPALKLYKNKQIKIACSISHYKEQTLGLCIKSVDDMNADFVSRYIVSGKSPMCNSFNASLDFACDVGADILFHTASDVIVQPYALLALLDVMDMDEHYLAVGKGYDPMFGKGASVGIWIWNMNILKRDFRFRDVFKQDLDLCERIEAATGKKRVYTKKSLNLGYHHPIWTAQDLFMKMRYSYPKYEDVRKKDMEDFVLSGLQDNPNNGALKAGLKGLELAQAHGMINGSKDNSVIDKEYMEATEDLHLSGNEYYVKHGCFQSYAMSRLRSIQPCVTRSENIEL